MSRREALRSATAIQHSTLDRIVAEQKAFADLESYGRWLRAMYRFHRDMERQIDACGAMKVVPGDSFRRRTSLLSEDLSDLGLGVASYVPRAPDAMTMAEALGMLYVTEGASLGARLLFVEAKKLGLSENFGARQLGFSAQDLLSWRYFLARLEAFDGDPDDDMQMIHSAQRTFVAALAHLSRQV